MIGTPIQTIGVPTKMTGVPIQTVGSLTKTIGEPAETIGAPTKMIGTPIQIVGTHTKTIGRPAKPKGIRAICDIFLTNLRRDVPLCVSTIYPPPHLRKVAITASPKLRAIVFLEEKIPVKKQNRL